MIRKLLKKYFLLFIVVVFCISTGYAYLNSSLYINGTSIISANVWDVGLDNLNVTAGSVAAIKEPTIENTTTTFEVKLNNKADFYEFTVDVVNSGEMDAKLGSLVETTGLTQEQEQYFEHTVTYQNNEPIQVNQIVKKDEFVRLKSKVEYKEEVNITSVPESVKTLKLSIKMNYDLDDGNGNIIDNNGKLINIVSGDGTNVGDEICIGTECFNVISSDAETVTMLSKMNLTLEDIPKQSSAINEIIFSYTDYWLKYENDIESIVEKYGNQLPVYVFDENSLIYPYVNNYKKYFDSLGVYLKKVRLMRYEEFIDLGCREETMKCTNELDWLYSTTFWGGSAVLYETIVSLYSHNFFDVHATYNFTKKGVRPVIEISKKLLYDENFLSELIIDSNIYKFEEGMTWEEWINSGYNIILLRDGGNDIITNNGANIMNGSNIVLKSDIIISNNQYSIDGSAFEGQ